jgi:predicted acylesterase/phospholipase RssA
MVVSGEGAIKQKRRERALVLQQLWLSLLLTVASFQRSVAPHYYITIYKTAVLGIIYLMSRAMEGVHSDESADDRKRSATLSTAKRRTKRQKVDCDNDNGNTITVIANETNVAIQVHRTSLFDRNIPEWTADVIRSPSAQQAVSDRTTALFDAENNNNDNENNNNRNQPFPHNNLAARKASGDSWVETASTTIVSLPPLILVQADASSKQSQTPFNHSTSSNPPKNEAGLKPISPTSFLCKYKWRLFLFLVVVAGLPVVQVWTQQQFVFVHRPRVHAHIHIPTYMCKDDDSLLTTRTLRGFLSEPFHLAMAPAFFGFYAYFGALAAWEDGIDSTMLRNASWLESVAGGSAGAMAAILIAAGIPPRRAADFCATATLGKFADPPGIGAFLKGDKFERIMEDFLREELPHHSLQLEDAIVPVAVSGFDLRSMKGKILKQGSMARAARASATFPFLFQPVPWRSNNESYLLIDGGVTDPYGLNGLDALTDHLPQRVVNLILTDIFEFSSPPGPSTLPNNTQLLTITIRNLPNCGPWAMKNGPIAGKAAYKAMMSSLDIQLYKGKEGSNHFELHIDASTFR